MKPQPIFAATFVRDRPPLPLDEDGVRQLRLTLKRLLRQYGWRATSVVEVKAGTIVPSVSPMGDNSLEPMGSTGGVSAIVDTETKKAGR